MMVQKWSFFLSLLPILLGGCAPAPTPPQGEEPGLTVPEQAAQLASRILILDTHIDVPDRLMKGMEDISVRTDGGDFDYPRAREGGLDAAFMSIYVPVRLQETGQASEYAEHLINMVEGFQARWPNKFGLARSVAEVRSLFGSGKIALPMGMENGAPIGSELGNLKHFFDRGIRYITLAHSTSNQISDSSYDPRRRWKGLSPFGRQVIGEMNRLGIMIDVSHVSDQAFHQVLQLTKAPVIASHSSCRHFTPGWERNMSDEMIRLLAQNGGVIQISFGSSFINNEFRMGEDERDLEIDQLLQKRGLQKGDPEAERMIEDYDRRKPLRLATVSQVADHIDHVRDLVGVEHVGFGSDFDGVDWTTPEGLRDVSKYPNLLAELLERGYSRAEIEKICSGNLLRVWSEVEKTAARLQGHQ